MDRTIAQDDIFKAQLTALIPNMRAFANSLCGNHSQADDLAQEALLKAWNSRASYQLGTNLKAWVFMITRNQFYSDKRRSWRQVWLDPEVAERTLTAITHPTASLELDEVRRALARLPHDQREALILIGAGGMSYEEAAEICGAAVGTIKSRVSRARVRLAAILETGDYLEDEIMPSDAMACIIGQMDYLCGAGRQAA